ncbi:MAG: SAVED domain-containing protein [Agriterribacter sp.]
MHSFTKNDLKVSTAFIEKFAKMYITQRTEKTGVDTTITTSVLFNNTGFDTKSLEKIVTKHLVAIDTKREKDLSPNILNDIYRSDLGELLMTYYFEEKIDTKFRFLIPVKNISYRELANQPGRGLDAIGFNTNNNKVNLLFGEAKVSTEKKSPPQVVDVSTDSIYATQTKYRKQKTDVLNRLADLYKRLGSKDASIIGAAIIAIELDLSERFTITFGCVLVRDSSCVNEKLDWGKLRSDKKSFEPHIVHFSILSFDKTIEETVQLFYKKVQELIAA